MFNNPYMYNSFTPNIPMGMNAARGYASTIPRGMNAMRGATSLSNGMNAMRGATGAMGMNAVRGGTGLFSRLGGVFSSLRGFNWGGLINNASKTIGVINQTIPLVKQAGPMIRNMRSVMKIASIFKDETDPVSASKSSSTQISTENKKDTTTYSDSTVDNNTIKTQDNDFNYNSSNSPVFFVN